MTTTLTRIGDAVDDAVEELVPLVGKRAACQAVGLPRASYYRARVEPPVEGQGDGVVPGQVTTGSTPPRRVQVQPRALSEDEQARVLQVLHSPRFVDVAPATVYATLLDEGTYLCSESTMYRLLREHGETGDRRRLATHPARVKPELVADAPNRVWSWDFKCRRRHLMSYADLGTMPMVLVGVGLTSRVGVRGSA